MIKEKLALVPHKPGSYQMKNKDGFIIYVGKAKDLKNRLTSYFTGVHTGKTARLVEDIYDFEYIVTSSELESLILEINLIKKYNPKYNILLKDDKSYPYIELTNEKYPTVKVVRNVKRKRKKNNLFGPFPNVKAARRTVEIINRVYPLRKCTHLKKEVCLYYHIHECLGYCTHEIDKDVINKMRKEIITFLKGDSSLVVTRLKEEMEASSQSMNYEKALELKQMLDDIEITLRKQKIDLNHNYNFDLFNYYVENNYLSIQVFFIRNGILYGRDKAIFNIVEEVEEEFLNYVIHFYDKKNILPKEVVVSPMVDQELLSQYLDTKVVTFTKGKIKKLLDLAQENAKEYLNQQMDLITQNEKKRMDAKKELERILNCKNLSRMEAFDNSHLFGTYYVGGMVVFEDFVPLKQEYRKYKVDAEVKDDLSAMREVVYRRYYRVLMDNLEKPDLIVVDGGALQLNVVKEIVSSLNLNIKIIGLKKDDKHRTSTLLDENLNEIKLDRHSNLFIFLSKIQEEVHNYAISYHRNIKSKGMLTSVIDTIPGIGEVRKKQLLKKFGSLKKLKEASVTQLEEVLPKELAKKTNDFLKNL